MGTWLGWRAATTHALYGPDGFYRRERPAAHFRTSPHASPAFAAALLRLSHLVDADEIVDLGAGGGELLRALRVLDPVTSLVGVDLAGRPAGLPETVAWSDRVPPADAGRRLLIANEWLDNVPIDVAEVDPGGVARLVLVDPADGAERLGDPVTGADAAWLERWWPLAEPGTRAELGQPRDAAWADVIANLGDGLAVAIDYTHTALQRPPCGSLAGYRGGRAVRPVPDGSCDVTAHVALDACAAAGAAAGATGTHLTTQRATLAALGVDDTRPEIQIARDDPPRYLRALTAALEAAELRDPRGLGGFGWLLQSVGVALPALLTADLRFPSSFGT